MKVRSYKELFQLMIDYRYLFIYGLCSLVYLMWGNHIINNDEKVKLNDYIGSHRPKRGKHYDPLYKDSVWYWKCYEWSPRLAWLEDQIKKYS